MPRWRIPLRTTALAFSLPRRVAGMPIPRQTTVASWQHANMLAQACERRARLSTFQNDFNNRQLTVHKKEANSPISQTMSTFQNDFNNRQLTVHKKEAYSPISQTMTLEQVLATLSACDEEQLTPKDITTAVDVLRLDPNAASQLSPADPCLTKLVNAIQVHASNNLFTQDEVVSIIHGVSKLQTKLESFSESALGVIFNMVKRNVEPSPPHAVSSVVWAMGKFKSLHDLELLDALMQAGMGKLEILNARELSTTIHSLGRIGHCPLEGRGLDALLGAAMDKLDDFTPLHIANTLHALGKLKYRPSDIVLDEFLQAAEARSDEFEVRHVSALLHGLAVLEYRPSEVAMVDSLLVVAVDRVHALLPPHLANIFHALERLEHRPSDDQLLERLLRGASAKIHEFHPASIVRILRALAKLGFRPSDKQIVNKLLNALRGDMATLNAYMFNSAVFAAGKLANSRTDGHIVETFMIEAIRRQEEMMPQGIITVLHTVAEVNTSNEDVLASFLRIVVDRMDDLTAQGIIAALHALGKMKKLPPNSSEVVEALFRSELSKKDELTPMHIASTMRALVRLRYQPSDKEMMDSFLRVAMTQLDKFQPLEVADMLDALGKLRFQPSDGRVLSALVGAVTERMNEFTPREVSRTLAAIESLKSGSL